MTGKHFHKKVGGIWLTGYTAEQNKEAAVRRTSRFARSQYGRGVNNIWSGKCFIRFTLWLQS